MLEQIIKNLDSLIFSYIDIISSNTENFKFDFSKRVEKLFS